MPTGEPGGARAAAPPGHTSPTGGADEDHRKQLVDLAQALLDAIRAIRGYLANQPALAVVEAARALLDHKPAGIMAALDEHQSAAWTFERDRRWFKLQEALTAFDATDHRAAGSS